MEVRRSEVRRSISAEYGLGEWLHTHPALTKRKKELSLWLHHKLAPMLSRLKPGRG
jgi:hypothetical protein